MSCDVFLTSAIVWGIIRERWDLLQLNVFDRWTDNTETQTLAPVFKMFGVKPACLLSVLITHLQ